MSPPAALPPPAPPPLPLWVLATTEQAGEAVPLYSVLGLPWVHIVALFPGAVESSVSLCYSFKITFLFLLQDSEKARKYLSTEVIGIGGKEIVSRCATIAISTPGRAFLHPPFSAELLRVLHTQKGSTLSALKKLVEAPPGQTTVRRPTKFNN